MKMYGYDKVPFPGKRIKVNCSKGRQADEGKVIVSEKGVGCEKIKPAPTKKAVSQKSAASEPAPMAEKIPLVASVEAGVSAKPMRTKRMNFKSNWIPLPKVGEADDKTPTSPRKRTRLSNDSMEIDLQGPIRKKAHQPSTPTTWQPGMVNAPTVVQPKVGPCKDLPPDIDSRTTAEKETHNDAEVPSNDFPRVEVQSSDTPRVEVPSSDVPRVKLPSSNVSRVKVPSSTQSGPCRSTPRPSPSSRLLADPMDHLAKFIPPDHIGPFSSSQLADDLLAHFEKIIPPDYMSGVHVTNSDLIDLMLNNSAQTLIHMTILDHHIRKDAQAILDLKSQVSTLVAEVAATKVEKENLTSSLAEKEKRLEVAAQELNSSRGKVADLESQCSKLQEEKSSLCVDLKEAGKQISSLQENLSLKEMETKELKDSLKSTGDLLDTSRNKMKELVECCQTYKDRYKSQKEKSRSYLKQLSYVAKTRNTAWAFGYSWCFDTWKSRDPNLEGHSAIDFPPNHEAIKELMSLGVEEMPDAKGLGP